MQMEQIQQALVQDHINDLLRDGEAFRAERLTRGLSHSPDEDVGACDPEPITRRPVRVRLGHWLIGVGHALAGADGQPGRAERHAA
jgi:hypothetical protein